MTKKKTRKVVINSCYGGFGLSHAGVLEYCKMKGWQVKCWFDNSTAKIYLCLQDDPRFKDENIKDSYGKANITKEEFDKLEAMCLDKGERRMMLYPHYVIKEAKDWCDRDIKRDDPTLIKVVEKLGSAASGNCANLRIVEIPSDIEWVISEYDGLESVEEKHRSWG